MAIDPRAALDRLIGALEDFHQVAVSAQDPDAPSVLETGDALADAYTVYDDVMFTQFGVELPLDVYSTDEDDIEEDLDDEEDAVDLDDDEDDAVGLDDDYDEDESTSDADFADFDEEDDIDFS